MSDNLQRQQSTPGQIGPAASDRRAAMSQVA
jgi:hypothetical protein